MGKAEVNLNAFKVRKSSYSISWNEVFSIRDGQENSFAVFFFFLFFSRFPDHFSLSFFPPFSFSRFLGKRKFFFFPGGKRKIFFFFPWEKKVFFLLERKNIFLFSKLAKSKTWKFYFISSWFSLFNSYSEKGTYYPTPKTIFTNTSTSNLIFLRSATQNLIKFGV